MSIKWPAELIALSCMTYVALFLPLLMAFRLDAMRIRCKHAKTTDAVLQKALKDIDRGASAGSKLIALFLCPIGGGWLLYKVGFLGTVLGIKEFFVTLFHLGSFTTRRY
jgi:hypothetical protein